MAHLKHLMPDNTHHHGHVPWSTNQFFHVPCQVVMVVYIVWHQGHFNAPINTAPTIVLRKLCP